LHNGGAENCEGCDWGCWWDFKTRGKRCSNTQNRAFPFKDKSDCENFRTQYPNYLCTKWREDSSAVIIDRDVLTGTYDPTQYIGCTDPTALNFCANCTQDDGTCIYHVPFPPLDCADDCLRQPVSPPIPGWPGMTHIQCGITEFSFNKNTQELYVEVCGNNSSFEIADDNQGVILVGGPFATGNSTYMTPITTGRYTAKGTCSNSANPSYWDVCLDWSIPPSGGYPGSYKEVSCSNRKTPCCPSGNCIPQTPQVKDIV